MESPEAGPQPAAPPPAQPGRAVAPWRLIIAMAPPVKIAHKSCF